MPQSEASRLAAEAHGLNDTQERRPMMSASEEINAMIRAEQDPRWRALLLILQTMNQSLEEDSGLTRQVSAKFSALDKNFNAHVDRFDTTVNRSIGGWKLLAWAGPVIMLIVTGLAGYIFNGYLAQLDAVAKKTFEQDARFTASISALQLRVAVLDATQGEQAKSLEFLRLLLTKAK